MNRSQIASSIDRLFDAGFSLNAYVEFLNRGLDVDVSDPVDMIANGLPVSEVRNLHVESAMYLGQYVEPSTDLFNVDPRSRVGFYDIELAPGSRMESHHIGHKQLIRKLLERSLFSTSALPFGQAIVTLHSPGIRKWVISYVELPNSLASNGNQFFRRHYFYAGDRAYTHTLKRQAVDALIGSGDSLPYVKDLSAWFDVSSVGEAFFDQYKQLYCDVCDALEDIRSGDRRVAAEFNRRGITDDDFSKRLLGQIVFLYFLEKKGWFGVQRNGKWGSGSHEYLRGIFQKCDEEGRNFHEDYLEPLFFDALAIDRRSETDYYEMLDSRVPFLNGGLFEPLDGYDWRKVALPLPNSLFSNGEQADDGAQGTGILDVFDRYNFTVCESDPTEQEVAIDPEMLGKVFERLLSVKDRKSKGAHYTRRETVEYMCRESLAHYLALHMQGSATLEDTRSFLTLAYMGDDHDTLKDNAVAEHAKLADRLLSEIRICDPAAGSGAFPVGAMRQIVAARLALNNYLGGKGARNPYDLKRHVIEHCLYGVDSNTGAVQIADLRLWLSLVVDEDDVDSIQPLPNLDYKIVCADSLTGPVTHIGEGDMSWLYLQRWQALKDQLTTTTDPDEKEWLRAEIEKMRKSIKGSSGVLDFGLEFSGVFQEKGGFDVVIGNPPFVRADSPEPGYEDYRKHLVASGLYKYLYEKWDLFIAFFERGMQLLNSRGNLCFIASDAICTSKYASRLLDGLQTDMNTNSIDFFEDVEMWDASVTTVIINVGKVSTSGVVRKTIRSGEFDTIGDEIELNIEDFKLLGARGFRKRLKAIHISCPTCRLGELCYISVGMVLNADEKRAKGAFKVEDLVAEKKDPIHTKRYVEGKDIAAYVCERVRWLEWGTNRCPGLVRRPTFEQLYSSPKLLVGRITAGIYDDTGLVNHDGVMDFVRFVDLKAISNNSIALSVTKHCNLTRQAMERLSTGYDLKFLLAIVNSTFANRFLNEHRRHRMENYFYPDDYRELPIPVVGPKIQRPIVDLVNQIMSLTGRPGYLRDSTAQTEVKRLRGLVDASVDALYGIEFSST